MLDSDEPSWRLLLGGRWSVSVPATVVVIVMGVPFAMVEAQRVGAPPAARLVLANLVGGLALAGVLALAGATVLRSRARTPSPIAVVIAVWLGASAVRRVVSAAVAYLPQGELPFEPWLFAMTITASAAWLGILAYVLARNDFYRRRSRELAALGERLRAPARRALEDLRARRAELVTIIEAVIRPELVRLASQLRSVSEEPTRNELLALAGHVDTESRELVRHVSRSIADTGAAAADVRGAQFHGRPFGWRDLTQLRVNVTLTLLLKILLSVPWLVIVTGFEAWGSVFTAFVMSWGILLAGSVAWRVLRPVLRGWVVVVTYATYVLSQLIPYSLVLGDLFPTESAGRDVLLVAVGVLTGVVASLISQGIERNREMVRLAAAHNEDVLATSRARSQEIDRLDRQISELLHGPVQGRLATVAVALRLEAQRPGEDFRETAAACHRLLELAGDDISSIAAPIVPSALPLAEQLAAVQRQWHGFLDLFVDVDLSAVRALAEDPEATAAIQSAVAEAVTNASRHGGARNISARVELVSGGDAGEAFIVTVRDDGRGPASSVEPGAGLSGIERRGGSWSLEPRPEGGASLRVSIACR